MQIQLSPQTVEQICFSVLNRPYRTGSDLVKFFNEFGWEDIYPDDVGGKGHSRPTYTQEKLEQLNAQRRIHLAIYKEVDTRPFVNNMEYLEEIVATLNAYLQYDGLVLVNDGLQYKLKYLAGRNPQHPIKNIIFASDGPKPDIILKDALTNQIEIVKHEKHCLVFDGDTSDGVSWVALVDWWSKRKKLPAQDRETERDLYRRLLNSIPKDSPPAQMLFRTYYLRRNPLEHLPAVEHLPALLPEVYLHYDPKTIIERSGKKVLNRQRMDFLLLLPGDVRIVIEVDGKQHYAKGVLADPPTYAEMMHEDRELRLLGYEVYRFGGAELDGKQGEAVALTFFDRLLKKHKI